MSINEIINGTKSTLKKKYIKQNLLILIANLFDSDASHLTFLNEK